MKFRVYPYKQGSKSAKALAEALDGKVLRHVGSKYHPRDGDVVVNWGSSRIGRRDFAPATTLNADVAVAGDKWQSFEALDAAGVRTPPYTSKKDKAAGFVFPVMCRTKLKGHSGEGIVIAETANQLVDAPLYTQYVKKKDEYRVHVMADKAFFIQRKARKLDVEKPDWRVRNLKGGFVFVEVDKADVPEDVIVQAVKAIDALGLDFGGVDVIWNATEGNAYVLEANCACGLEERTADRYKEAIVHLVENLG